jgi:hypothetical protein
MHANESITLVNPSSFLHHCSSLLRSNSKGTQKVNGKIQKQIVIIK